MKVGATRSVLRLLVVLMLTVGLAGLTGSADPAGAQQPTATVTVDRATQTGTSRMSVGVTHTQYSLDPWADPQAVADGKALLTPAITYHNQHIYGWGTVNPNPSPGTYNWVSIDRRVQLMRDLGGTPVITLCCAPDWMTALGTESSSYPNLPPTSANFDEFAALARRVAERYPDVEHFVVWNEMKGLWNRGAGQWDLVAYTELYNAVYDALKAVNPNIQVGGPYLVIEGTDTDYGAWFTDSPITRRNDQVIDYWLEHANGADFIALDRNVQDFHDKRTYSEAEKLDLAPVFADPVAELRQRSSLPIWYIEQHFAGKAGGPLDFQAVGGASMLLHQLLGGTEVTFQWEPEQHTPGGRIEENLFSSARQAGGAEPYPLYYVYRLFTEHFGPGTPLFATTSSSATVEVLASDQVTLLLNKRDSPVEVTVDGVQQSLVGYEVRLIDTQGQLITSITAGGASPAPAGIEAELEASANAVTAAAEPAPPAAIVDPPADVAAQTANGLDAVSLDRRAVDDDAVLDGAVQGGPSPSGAAENDAAQNPGTDASAADVESSTSALVAEPLWLDQFSAEDSDDRVISMAADGVATYAVGGTYGSLNGQSHRAYQDGFVRRYNPDGTVVWTRQFGAVGDDGAAAIALYGSGADQAVYVGGSTDHNLDGPSRGLWDGVLRRYRPNGSLVWARQFGSAGDEFVTGVATDDSGVYVVGHTDASFAGRWWGYQDAFVRRYSHDGDIIWTRQFGTADPDYASSVTVVDAPDGPMVVVGGATAGGLAGSQTGVWDAYVRAYDTNGGVRWTRQYGTAGDDRILDLSPTTTSDEAGFYVTGYTEGALPGQSFTGIYDGYVRRYDAAGSEVWTRQFGTGTNDRATEVSVTRGGVHVVGWSRGAVGGTGNAGAADVSVHSFTHAGDPTTTQSLGGSGQDEGQAMTASLAALYIGGYTNGSLPGGGAINRVDGFAARLPDPDGYVAIDQFSRSVLRGWRQSELGGGYLLGGSFLGYTTEGGRGGMVFTGPGQGRQATMLGFTVADSSLVTAVGVDRLPTGNSVYAYAAARRVNPSTEYRAQIRISPSGQVTVRAVRVGQGWFPLGGEVTVPGAVATADRPIWVRFEVTGTAPTRLQIKAWPAGSAEPAGWLIDTTDSYGPLQQAGRIGFRSYLPASVTGTPPQVWFDDLTVRSLD